MPNKDVFFVNIAIGDFTDLSLKAIAALKKTQLIICENYKPARQLLKYLELPFYEGDFNVNSEERFLFSLSEKSVAEEFNYLRAKVFPSIQNIAVVSDCGSPLFEDPGKKLLSDLLSKFTKHYIAGVTSLSYLMMHAPFAVPFQMYGFLPIAKAERQAELQKIRAKKENVFLLETPYRLKMLCGDLRRFFLDWRIVFGYCLSTEQERVFSGYVADLIADLEKLPKNEFVFFLLPA